jgi:O-antigen/teichoic acid export membrane protein
MRLRDRLIKGTFLNFIAVAFNQGSTLIVNIIIARILMKETFGEYAMVQSTLLTVAALSQLATGYTASKYIAEYRSSDPEKAGRIMGLCAIVSAVMAGVGMIALIAMSPWLADRMLKAPHLATALMAGSGYLFFSSINGYQTGALSGLEAYGTLAKAGMASGTVAMATISLGAWWGGLPGAITGLSISALFRCAIHNIWLRLEARAHGIRPEYRGSFRREKRIILKFSLPAALAGYYSMPMIWLASSFLVRQPGGYGEMALYGAANSLRIMVLFLPNVINSVSLSVLNNEKAKGDMARYHKVFRANVLYILLISIAGVLFIGVLGRPLLQLFGKSFSAGHLLLWILLVSTVFEALSVALYQYVQSNARIWHAFLYICVPREALLVIASYFLIQLYGSVGLATAYLLSAIVGLILHCLLVAVLYMKEDKVLDFHAK